LDAAVERVDPAIVVHPGAPLRGRLRPVAVVLDVLLAGPHQLDRLAHGLGHRHGLRGLVGTAPAAEAAADEVDVDEGLFRRDAGRRGRRGQHRRRRLGRDPHVEPILLQPDRGVERLHSRMGLIGRLVEGFDDLAAGLGEGRLGVAVVTRGGHGTVRPVAVELVEVGLLHLARLADVPLDLEVVGGLLGAPELVGGHRHRSVQLDHLEDAHAAPDGAVVDALQLAARHRTLDHRGVDHPRHAGVEPVLGRAVELGAGVEARSGFADQAVLFRRLDLGFLVELDRDGAGADRAIGELPTRRHVLDDAVRGLAFGGVALPLAGGGLDQAHARAGAGLLQHVDRRAHPLAPDRGHGAIGFQGQVAIGRGVFALHLGPVAVQLLGHQHGQGGGGALPQFVVRQADGDGVVRVDHQEGRELVRRDGLWRLQQTHGPRSGGLVGGEGAFGQGHADGEAAAGREHGQDRLAAGRGLEDGVHGLRPSDRPSARRRDGRPS
jgi:hypothetical protein